MIRHGMSSDSFKLITYRRRRQKECFSKQCPTFNIKEELIIDTFTAERRVIAAKEELSVSEFYTSVLSILHRSVSLVEGSTISKILCYGLGNFTQCVSARYQLALLLLLKKHTTAKVFVYDPVFSALECQLISSFGCQLLPFNEEGKHTIDKNEVTLTYLPHCSKQLINNFLWANWGLGLKDCIIFGNSFSKIIDTQLKSTLKSSACYILDIFPYTEEISIANSFKYTDIFNDLAISVFPIKKLSSVKRDFWVPRENPKYCDSDTEFITAKFVSALNL
uniref:(California timema) hypothetical protein n=1 Tax=Timema californicum TaxID=61474 RepID=A0A7R9J8L3_TIMCA|nr:unnamed protein product [Timema californicum]